ncbi:hypothetical protein NECAME_13086 [Necator americanus]|uniref:Uncharacterized protein n=1 Tax=Necator americanus TaxID=51031 RepID=W2T014_NECAM|nr:hypothetical protein NECAME_13086 [Necator americanus]ETN74292.1 hypothetical protein NECAME_13086 [Necator americanus]
MAPLTSLPDYGLNTDDVRYLSVESVIRGRGPDRLKFLDLEGRWSLSGKSIPFISSAFNHLERLNDARVPFRDIVDEPINAIGMVGWTPSFEPAKEFEERKPPAKFKLPVPVLVEEEVPPSPRERMPHRTAGYGPAHQKRKLSIPDRSRSVSPMRMESPIPTYDRYAKYERNRTGDELQNALAESKDQMSYVPYIDWYGMLWHLVEEKITYIRVEETEYYID